MKYFKCTVCGYVHEGSEPPDKCPVCNAPKEKFIELPEDDIVTPHWAGRLFHAHCVTFRANCPR